MFKGKFYETLFVALSPVHIVSDTILFTIFHALPTQYIFRTDPLSSGGCVSCPQVQTLVSGIRQPRISTQLFQSALLFRSIVSWYSLLICTYVVVQGTTGPCPVI